MNYHCAKFCTNISTNMDTTHIFPFLAIFPRNLSILPPKYHFLPIHLGLIANIIGYIITTYIQNFMFLSKS